MNAAAPVTAVVGLGLIGGSIMRRLRGGGQPATGWDADPAVRAAARRAGLVVSDSLAEAVVDRELVVVAVPPSAAAPAAIEALELAPQVNVCDVCSVKGPVLGAVHEKVGAAAQRFVGGHPLAGSETGGFESSHEDLFAGASWALCPGRAALTAVLATARLVEALGAHPVFLTAEQHDQAVARSSHVPHVLAGVTARCAAARPAAVLSGGALRDGVRVAGSDPGLWSEILLANAAVVASVLGELEQALEIARAALNARDGDALAEALESGLTARAAILRARWGPVGWEPREIPRDSWRETLVDLGGRGLRVRGLRIVAEGLRFEVAAGPADSPGRA